MRLIRTRFEALALLLLSLGIAALAGVAGVSVYLALQARADVVVWRVAAQQQRLLERVQLLVDDAETGQRGFLLTDGDPAYLKPYEQAVAELPGELGALQSAMSGTALSRTAGELRGEVEAKLAELARTIALQRAGDARGASALVRTDVGRQLMQDVRARIASIEELLGRDLTDNIDRLEWLSRGAVIVAVVGGSLVVILGIAGLLLAIRNTRRLEQARAAVAFANESLEDRVRERTAALAQANEEVQRFAYIVSHDLRSPLVNVMGFTQELTIGSETLTEQIEVMRADAEPEARAAALAKVETVVRDDIPEAVGFIRTATERMDGLINAILRISREGQRRLTPERISLTELFGRLSASVAHQAGERAATIEVEANLPTVIADRLALEQVFGNLLDNALKYLQHGRPGRIAVRGHVAGATVCVDIEDNGRGVSPADQERIFELFRRAGRQDQPGEGIGLAHVRVLLRRLGGTITLRSRQGEGSVFTVVIPRSTPGEAHA